MGQTLRLRKMYGMIFLLKPMVRNRYSLLVAGLFGVAVGIIGAAFGIVVGFLGSAFGLVVGGIACIFTGIFHLGLVTIEALTSIGVGAILTALGLLLAVPSVWAIGVWIPKGVRAFFCWAKGLLHRNKGGNEI